MSTPADCINVGHSQIACGFVVEFEDIITTRYMNPSSTNVGGYPASSMYTFLQNNIYNALPGDLWNVIIDTTVVSGHGSTSGESNFTSTNKLYFLSTKEVWGKEGTGTNIVNDTAEVETRQLDYYKNKGETTANYASAKKIDSSETNIQWWLRSSKSNNDKGFFSVFSSGQYSSANANYSFGVAPAFRIG